MFKEARQKHAKQFAHRTRISGTGAADATPGNTAGIVIWINADAMTAERLTKQTKTDNWSEVMNAGTWNQLQPIDRNVTKRANHQLSRRKASDHSQDYQAVEIVCIFNPRVLQFSAH